MLSLSCAWGILRILTPNNSVHSIISKYLNKVSRWVGKRYLSKVFSLTYNICIFIFMFSGIISIPYIEGIEITCTHRTWIQGNAEYKCMTRMCLPWIYDKIIYTMSIKMCNARSCFHVSIQIGTLIRYERLT